MRPEFYPWVGKNPWRREWLPTPVFLPGKFHGQRGLAGYSPWTHKEPETTKRLTLSLSWSPLTHTTPLICTIIWKIHPFKLSKPHSLLHTAVFHGILSSSREQLLSIPHYPSWLSNMIPQGGRHLAQKSRIYSSTKSK